MTVHDFNFCIWKTSLDEYDLPIFKSANTFGAHNTCGAFSPTRASVIFISKTDGIDVWDFFDQSHKPSMKINFTASALTFFSFQHTESMTRNQHIGFGDDSEGTLFLFNVPSNLRVPQSEEVENMTNFWQREIAKCQYQIKRKKVRDEEKAKFEQARALEEAAKGDDITNPDAEDEELAAEMEEEESYQDFLIGHKAAMGLISEEELEKIKEAKKNRLRNQRRNQLRTDFPYLNRNRDC